MSVITVWVNSTYCCSGQMQCVSNELNILPVPLGIEMESEPMVKGAACL